MFGICKIPTSGTACVQIVFLIKKKNPKLVEWLGSNPKIAEPTDVLLVWFNSNNYLLNQCVSYGQIPVLRTRKSNFPRMVILSRTRHTLVFRQPAYYKLFETVHRSQIIASRTACSLYLSYKEFHYLCIVLNGSDGCNIIVSFVVINTTISGTPIANSGAAAKHTVY